MAKRQTRRSISFNVAIYDAVVAEAARRKLPASHYVELLVRKAIKGLPETHHVPVEHVATMKQRRPPRAPAPLIPSAHEIAELRPVRVVVDGETGVLRCVWRTE